MKKKLAALIIAVVCIIMMLFTTASVYAADAKWKDADFKNASLKYNNHLASVSAEMCDMAQGDNPKNIKKLLKDYGLKHVTPYNYGKSGAFVIGYKVVKINGTKTPVLTIICRGSTTLDEFIGDIAKGAYPVSTLGCSVYDNVYSFEKGIWKELPIYIGKYSELSNAKSVKVLITGHSLGGAAANLLGARINSYVKSTNKAKKWWRNKVSSSKNVFVYTYGAITVLAQKDNVSEGYENIHNIYNYYDSFGPNGNVGLINSAKNQLRVLGINLDNISTPYAKFGHTELYKTLKSSEQLLSWNNHDMGSNYKKAVLDGHVICSNANPNKKMKAYRDIIKAGNSVYCNAWGVCRVNLKTKKSKVLNDVSYYESGSGRGDYFNQGITAMSKKENYIYYLYYVSERNYDTNIDYSQLDLYRINLTSGKDELLAKKVDSYVIEDNKIYYKQYDSFLSGDWYNYQTSGGTYYVMNLDGSLKEPFGCEITMLSKAKNVKGYSIDGRYVYNERDGLWSKFWLKKPNGKKVYIRKLNGKDGPRGR